ncbi:MAG: aminopeptidase P family protein, partial [Gemmatimonadota bacterium]
MTISRREFAGSVAGLVGAAALGRHTAPESPADPCHLPPSVQALTNLTGGIAPITDAERRQRIAKAQRLMQEHGIAAVVVEPGTTMRYFTAVSWWPS